MNHVWSEKIQGVLTLYLSRKLRFHDRFQRQYMDLFALGNGRKLRILEIGCGPGALAGALHRWYPNAEIVAIDRDSIFIEYAKENVSGVTFLEGDATALPFKDGTFDVTISNTVSEHIDPEKFYGEQRRVLKENGVCLVLSARKGIRHTAQCLRETPEERQFWESIPMEGDVLREYGIGKYVMTEQELPAAMESRGFCDVSTGYAVIPLTPDDAAMDLEMAEEIICADREAAVEAVLSTHDDRATDIEKLIRAKYDTRLNQLRSGDRQWDTETAITMVIRGVKE